MENPTAKMNQMRMLAVSIDFSRFFFKIQIVRTHFLKAVCCCTVID